MCPACIVNCVCKWVMFKKEKKKYIVQNWFYTFGPFFFLKFKLFFTVSCLRWWWWWGPSVLPRTHTNTLSLYFLGNQKGTFACSNFSYVPLEKSDESVSQKLEAYFAWAKVNFVRKSLFGVFWSHKLCSITHSPIQPPQPPPPPPHISTVNFCGNNTLYENYTLTSSIHIHLHILYHWGVFTLHTHLLHTHTLCLLNFHRRTQRLLGSILGISTFVITLNTIHHVTCKLGPSTSLRHMPHFKRLACTSKVNLF